MGSMRLLLAISVVLSHTLGFYFVGGEVAVQLFYLISGYLISYVLIERRSYQNKRTFYLNRALRIYPYYLVILLASVLFYSQIGFELIQAEKIDYAVTGLPESTRYLTYISNLLIFGQDWFLFSAIEDGELVLSTNFRDTEIKIWHSFYVPQAWTLGVELSFYLFAPFILHKRNLLLLILLASVCLRVFLLNDGIGLNDPWTYRFFPLELGVFLLGSLCHQLTIKRCKISIIYAKAANFVLVIAFFSCFFYFLVPQSIFSRVLIIMILVMALPALFEWQKRHKWDRFLGELSYPVYLVHMLTIGIIDWLFLQMSIDGPDPYARAAAVLVCTLAFSLALNLSIGKLIESQRVSVRTGYQ